MSRVLKFLQIADDQTTCVGCAKTIQTNRYRKVQKCHDCLTVEYQKRDEQALQYLKKMNDILEKRDLPKVTIPDLPENIRYFDD